MTRNITLLENVDGKWEQSSSQLICPLEDKKETMVYILQLTGNK
jgi:hypothetical protein